MEVSEFLQLFLSRASRAWLSPSQTGSVQYNFQHQVRVLPVICTNKTFISLNRENGEDKDEFTISQSLSSISCIEASDLGKLFVYCYLRC